jgi:PucR family transcriptional regulator, purine catabolism regulatory protein
MEGLGQSLEEAKLAAVGSRYLRGGTPTHYEELGADRLLLLLHRDAPDELQSFVQATLGPLLEHDRRSSVKLAPTIEAYVRHGGRLRETASALYVHRNTLAYRLERASDLLGLDLRDPHRRLAVELAFRALPLIEAPN